MTGLAFCVLLQAAVLGVEGTPYTHAFKTAQGNDQPLVVLIGAEWCPGCRTMKHATLPSLMRRGGMRDVQFSTVDTDNDPALARRLMQGQSIPQLIVYYRGPEGWKRSQLVGARSEAEVQAVVARAVAEQAKAGKVASSTN
jgi:thioredoxin-like negative regulator of GroEL